MVGFAGQMDGTLLTTTNGGSTWTPYSYSNNALWSAYFIDTDTGWIAGNHGVILKTVNGGIPVGMNTLNSKEQTANLTQNIPNPFKGHTTIEYFIPEPCFVELTIFDIFGRKVINLVNKNQTPGDYHVNYVPSVAGLENAT
jgi:hypothetical protein